MCTQALKMGGGEKKQRLVTEGKINSLCCDDDECYTFINIMAYFIHHFSLVPDALQMVLTERFN